MQELYHQVGVYVCDSFSFFFDGICDTFYYRFGNYLCDSLSLSLSNCSYMFNGFFIGFWTSLDVVVGKKHIFIFESANKYVYDLISIGNSFLKLLNCSKGLSFNYAMFCRPNIFSGFLNSRHIGRITATGIFLNVKISNLGYLAVDKLQGVRFSVNKRMFNFVSKHSTFFLNVLPCTGKISKIPKPSFSNFKNKVLSKLRIFIGGFLPTRLVSEVDISNIFNVICTSSIGGLYSDLKKGLGDRYIYYNLNKLAIFCRSFVVDYSLYKKAYASYINFMKGLESRRAKKKTFYRSLYILNYWLSDYKSFDGKSSIYFVWRFDHRGRVYQIGTDTPMSNKLIRFCLESNYKYSFSKYANIIKIDISKHFFGSSFTDSFLLQSFNKNIDIWLKNKLFFIKKADNCFGFLRGLLEYECYLYDNNYKTSYLISLDGTANVYQHICCATLDKSLALSVNVLPTNKPNDLYSSILILIKRKKEFCNLRISRKAIKKVVMCYAYGLTDHGIFNSLKKDLPYLDSLTLTKLGSAVVYLLQETYPSVFWFRNRLEHLVSKKGELNESLFIKNSFLEWTHKKTKTIKDVFVYTKPFNLKRSKRRIYLLKNTDTLNIKKMKSSITANYIHHLDSEALMSTVLKYSKYTNNKPIFTIHDCFMVPACYKELTIRAFKESLLEMYGNGNKIEELYTSNGVVLDKKDHLKVTPFKLKELLSSKYLLN